MNKLQKYLDQHPVEGLKKSDIPDIYNFSSIGTVLRILDQYTNSDFINQINEFFLMNINPLMRHEDKLTYREILFRLTDRAKKYLGSQKVIISGTSEISEKLINDKKVASVLLRWENELPSFNEANIEYVIENSLSNIEKIITLREEYQSLCADYINLLTLKSKKDNFKFLPRYNVSDVPWFLFWLKFGEKESLSLQAFLDLKNLPSVITSDNRIKIPGIFSLNQSYNIEIEELSEKFTKRLAIERTFKDLGTQQSVVTVFFDIVKFTKINSTYQPHFVEYLNRCVRKAVYYWDIHERRLIIQPTGDGVAMSILEDKKDEVPSAELGVKLARKVLKYLNVNIDSFKDKLNDIYQISRHNKEPDELNYFPIRTGIHFHQDNRLMIDANGNFNVCGKGINEAHRIMNCGKKGHLLVSPSLITLLDSSSYKFSDPIEYAIPGKDDGEKHKFYHYLGNSIGGGEENEPWINRKNIWVARSGNIDQKVI